MFTDNIAKLYQNYGILADAKDDISKHEKEYLEILAAVKGSDKEKRLASQFIVKFFNSFPNLADPAIEAQFELCEDDDIAIRKRAIKDLPKLCKHHKEHTQRIADILAQLLQTDDTAESNIITNSLLSILKIDAKGALTGLFSQINKNSYQNSYVFVCCEVINEVVRERCIKFLATEVKKLGREVINKEAEELIISECKKLLESQDVIADEFDHIMDLLTWSRLGQSPLGRKELVEIVAAFSFTPDVCHPEDPEYLERITQCSQHAISLFSAQVDSNQFINYFCDHVIRRWDEIPTHDGAANAKLDLLKLFAELTEHCGELENPQQKIDAVYDLLMKYLPEAPVEGDEKDGNKSEDNPDEAKSPPSLQFSYIECALFSLHSLYRKSPDSLTADAFKLKALRLRLQYTAHLTQGYIRKLKEVTQEQKGEDANSEENKLKVAALKTISNINTLITDFFRTPPSFKSKLLLSFQSKKSEKEIKEQSDSEDDKQSSGQRHHLATFDKSHEKRSRNGDRTLKLYTPPCGKYSSRLNDKKSPEKLSTGGDKTLNLYTPPCGKYSSRLNDKKSPEKLSTSGDRTLNLYTPPRSKYSSRLNDKKSPEKLSTSGDRTLNLYTPPRGKYSSRLNDKKSPEKLSTSGDRTVNLYTSPCGKYTSRLNDKKSPEKLSTSGDRTLNLYTSPCGKYSSRLINNARFLEPNSGEGRGGYGGHSSSSSTAFTSPQLEIDPALERRFWSIYNWYKGA